MRRIDLQSTCYSLRAIDFDKPNRLVKWLILLMAWWSSLDLPACAGVILLPGGISEERAYLRSGAIEQEATGPGASTYLGFEDSPAHAPYMTGYATSGVNQFSESTGGFVGSPMSDSSFLLYVIADLWTDAKTFWTDEEPPDGWEAPTTFLSASVHYSALFRVEEGGTADLSIELIAGGDATHRMTSDVWFQISRIGSSSPLIASEDEFFSGGTEFGGAPIILEAGDYRVDLPWTGIFEFDVIDDTTTSVIAGELRLIFRSIEGQLSPVPEASSVAIWAGLGIAMGLAFSIRRMTRRGQSNVTGCHRKPSRSPVRAATRAELVRRCSPLEIALRMSEQK